MNRTRTSTLDAFGLRNQRNRIYPALSASDGSTLNLDFTNGSSLDSSFTYTRNSPATYINSSGYLTTMAAAATNDPTKARFDYDPTTLAPKGLLLEGNATNLQRYSQTFVTGSSIWYITQGSIDEGVPGDAPDGTSPSYIFSEPASGTGAGQLQINGSSASLAVSTTYTVSFWAKAGTRSKVLWRCDGGGKDVGFNLDTGVATVVAGTFTNTRMTAYSRDLYRCEATWANVNAGGFPSIYTATGTGTTYTTSYTCDGSNVELWGFQLEVGTGASSYIATVASQVQRVSDECYIADISGLNYSNTNGSMAMQFMYAKQSTSYIEQIGFMAATDVPTLESFANALSFFTAVRGASLSSGGQNEISRPFTLNTFVKYASSFNTTLDPILIVNLNGSAASTNKVGTGNMYNATRFVFGRVPASTYGSFFGSITIKSVKYWNTTKTAAELVALTA